MKNKILTLPGEYIAGFVDGEGSFPLLYRKDSHPKNHNRVYFYWSPRFMICLNINDIEILERIKKTLQCGTISKSNNLATYQVSNFFELLNKIIPFFEKNPLQAKKRQDFDLWKQAVKILEEFKTKEFKPFEPKTLPESAHDKLMFLRQEMLKYKPSNKIYKHN